MKTTKPEEQHQCLATDALDELLQALDLTISAAFENNHTGRQVAANINLLVQGARAMAGLEDE